MKKLMEYIRPHWAIMTLGLIIKFFASMMDLVIPSILEKIIDDVVPTKQPRLIFLWGGVMVLCALLSVSTNIIANRMAAKSAGKVTLALRHDLFSRVSHLSARQTDAFTIPSLVSRLTSDTYNVNEMVSRVQRMGVRAPILLIGGIIITATMDPTLTLILVATLPFIFIVVLGISKISIPLYTYTQSVLDKLVETVQENVTGVRVIKALSKTEYEKNRFDNVNETLSASEQKASAVMAISNPTTTLILNLGLCAVVLVGAYRVSGGKAQPGAIIAFLSYFTIILNAMLGVTRIFTLCAKGAASAGRIQEVLNTPEDMQPESLPSIPTEQKIVFDNVSFSYHKNRNILTDVSFSLGQGQTLGIIGTTGSGKSTLIQLLIRFYDPDSGNIYIDGKNIRSMSREELAKKFGMAFQNDFWMADTIRENVNYGRNLSDKAILRALHHAQAMEFVSSKPEGLNHRLTVRGTNLSGGQKQRLLIARALAGDPEILILDDSSSALDYKTDAALRRCLNQDYPNTTKVIIAQRISAISHADLILVLDDGQVVGCGTHEELLESCQMYAVIAENQMSLKGGLEYAQ